SRIRSSATWWIRSTRSRCLAAKLRHRRPSRDDGRIGQEERSRNMSAYEISRDESHGFAPTQAQDLALRHPHQLQTGLLPRADDERAGDDSLTLKDLGRIILKYKWTLLMVVALCCAVAAIRTFLSTPIYRSTVILQIDRATPRVVR